MSNIPYRELAYTPHGALSAAPCRGRFSGLSVVRHGTRSPHINQVVTCVFILNCDFFVLHTNRTAAVEWSIRTHSLNRAMAPIMQSTYPHLDIDAWLTVLDLHQYAGKSLFISSLRKARQYNSPFLLVARPQKASGSL